MEQNLGEKKLSSKPGDSLLLDISDSERLFISHVHIYTLREMKIYKEGARTYQQCKNCPDTELTLDRQFSCPTILVILQRITDCSQHDLYSDICLDLADVVYRTFGLT
ncbi:hypothetical protein TNCV_3114721 [Trichonephila clavipes]|nr:hypothetical protein TNCV_3114721 [Trichonephila clavipes]